MTGPSTMAHHHELHAIIDHDREELDAANRMIADLKDEVGRLQTHLRGCCGEDYETCPAAKQEASS